MKTEPQNRKALLPLDHDEADAISDRKTDEN